MDFEYLGEVPVLTIDVNEDFKYNENKSGNMIEKVTDFFLCSGSNLRASLLRLLNEQIFFFLLHKLNTNYVR